MEDETVSALREIARLLERRVEQHDEQVARTEATRRRSEETIARIKEKQGPVLSIQEQQEQRRAETRENARRNELFQERLLEELERHNRLLEKLVEKLSG